MPMIISIKNMVCPRCIDTVKQIMGKHEVAYQSISLGHVVTQELVDDQTLAKIQKDLNAVGFALLSDKDAVLINQIKSIIIEKIHFGQHQSRYKLSEDLARELGINYSQISKTFSRVAGLTIEKFVINQKIEKAKELISYDELSIAEIADELSFSSAAHLSSLFKKVTGMTATEYKKHVIKTRNHIDSL